VPDMPRVTASDTQPLPLPQPALPSRWTLVVRVRYILAAVLVLTGLAATLSSCPGTAGPADYPYGDTPAGQEGY
jgi:hypothetical protein